MNWIGLGSSGVLQLPQEEGGERGRFERGLLLLRRRVHGARQGDDAFAISRATLRVITPYVDACDASWNLSSVPVFKNEGSLV